MNDLDQKLTVPTWFSAPRFTAGIPRGAFVLTVVGALFYSLILTWWFGPLIFVLVYAPLAKAHRNDPAALRVWLYSLTKGIDRLNVTQQRPINIIIE